MSKFDKQMGLMKASVSARLPPPEPARRGFHKIARDRTIRKPWALVAERERLVFSPFFRGNGRFETAVIKRYVSEKQARQALERFGASSEPFYLKHYRSWRIEYRPQ